LKILVLLLVYPAVPAFGIWVQMCADSLFHLRLWSSIGAAIVGLLVLVPGHSFSGVWSSSLANRLTMIAMLGITQAEFVLMERILVGD
jgi:hypothetical protein